ncbi:hypothetical protein KKB99_04270 [bacterium]|nr:hypothetical protein [bacterium]MBU1025209.1 hypothetical protein [bacterium]
MTDGNREPIQGGYILLSRKLLKSGIMDESPIHLKIWIWMLMQASFKDHGNLKRGQFFTSYKKMQKAMARKIGYRTEKPTIKEIRGVMKFLMKVRMVGTMKVLHGTIITILNYDHYQNMINYKIRHEGHNEGTNEGHNKKKEGFKEEKTLRKKPAKNTCPCNQILDLYHAILAELPQVGNFTERRRAMLSARWNEKAKSGRGLYSNTLEFWEAFLKYISQSDFLMGRKTEWRANFEWIITKRNFYKIIEGNYHK